MRILLTTAAIAAMAASAACGGDSTSTSTPTTTSSTIAASAAPKTPAPATTATVPTQTANPPRTPAAGKTTAATAAAPTKPRGGVVDVTGIVGTLNLNGNVIEIKRLQGAAVTQIAVDSATVIRKAAGGRVQLSDIHSSDRIIATGKLNDRQDQLIATEITVQDVVPGAQPGG